jgi:chitinase
MRKLTLKKIVALAALSFLLSHPVSYAAEREIPSEKLVSVYLLIDTPERLAKYTQDLRKIAKPNFNRVIFSFVKPSLSQYHAGSLANTGILGYFEQGDGKGTQAFAQLKEAILLSKQKNIQTFLSVGGWNYSCNYAVYGNLCGAPPSKEVTYDYFPDPTDPTQKQLADESYKNLVQLTNDLGLDGIDFDYEEFWHADHYAMSWTPGSLGEWATAIATTIKDHGGPTYDNLMKWGTSGEAGAGGAAVMPKTIDKVHAILHAIIDDPAAKNLLFATAAPPVGARPITGFVYGDTAPNIYEKGGLWWKGNLKGLWYHLNEKDAALVSHFDSLGLMTYDLCGDNPAICAPYAGAPLDLPGQVNAYMQDYHNWLKSSKSTDAQLTIDSIGKVLFLPAKYQIKAKVQFGFEVNKPAYPRNPQGILQLTNSLVDKITQQQKESDGVIIWEMYSKPNTEVPDATTVHYTIKQSCKTFLAEDTRYDCEAEFPSAL